MAAILGAGKLTLSGDVGDFGFGDCFSHSDVVLALAQIEDDEALTVFLNSGGGYAAEGAAIHALLARRAGSTDVVVDGVAASAASLIAMAGDTVTMSAGSVMMIHDPATITIGDAAAHAKSVEGLEALATSYARVYAAKSGKSVEEARTIMKAERWFTPEEAVADGFADAMSGDASKPVAAFDYRIYAHAPQRLVALASKKNWRRPDAKTPAVTAAHHSQNPEKSMTDKERADQLAAELDSMTKRATTAEAAVANAGRDDKARADADELATLRAEKADRERSDAIMALEEAKGREAQAKALCEAGVTAENAKKVLASMPKAEEDAGSYERRRLNGEGLNGDSKSTAKGNKTVLASAVDRVNKRR